MVHGISNLQEGDKVKVILHTVGYKSYMKKETYIGYVLKIYPTYIVVDTGEYRITVLKADVQCGDAQIKLCG